MIEINRQHDSSWLGNGNSRWVVLTHLLSNADEETPCNNSQGIGRLFRADNIKDEINVATLGLINRGWVAIPNTYFLEIAVLCNKGAQQTMLLLSIGEKFKVSRFDGGVKSVIRGSWVLDKLKQKNLLDSSKASMV
jgi:hypothetical protein